MREGKRDGSSRKRRSFQPFLSPPLSHRAPLSSLSQSKQTNKNNTSDASPPDFEALAADLPEDHPFAVRDEVSPEEAELAAARLKVRRGLPLRDLSGARGFSDEEKR